MTLAPLALPALLVGCYLEAPCGDTYVYNDASNTCALPALDAGPAPDASVQMDAGFLADAGSFADGSVIDASEPDTGAMCPDPGFGIVCSAAGEGSPECLCEANFCALQPGQATGFCTRIACLGTTDVCPAGYNCMDLSIIAPEVGSICVPNQ